MVTVAQLVRALDCDSGGRGFEPRQSPQETAGVAVFFLFAPPRISTQNVMRRYRLPLKIERRGADDEDMLEFACEAAFIITFSRAA